MKNKVLELWPEIKWINDAELREKTILVWAKALEKSVLEPGDLFPLHCCVDPI